MHLTQNGEAIFPGLSESFLHFLDRFVNYQLALRTPGIWPL